MGVGWLCVTVVAVVSLIVLASGAVWFRLKKCAKKEAEMTFDLYLGKLEDDDIPICDTAKYLELTNGIVRKLPKL